MKQKTMTIFTRTPLHVGAGNSVGAIDSPIMRERHTRIPIIPGSSLKGVLADLWNEKDDNGRWGRSSEGEGLFGRGSDTDAKAGSLLIGEARVLAFPVRSAKGCFAWVTCPLVLNRYARDTGVKLPELDVDKLTENSCFGSEDLLLGDFVVLEEYRLKSIDLAEEIAETLKERLKDNVLWQSVSEHLVVLNDSMFSYFVENACDVITRIRVNDETGTAEKGGLFNQEQVPSETLFYSVISEQTVGGNNVDALVKLSDKLKSVGNILQIGGNETIGLGFCDVEVK